ncbi:protein tipE-like [Daphnia pulicaria]|uniref:protein tipE-like n=1 Tax=Daphnia pulicaria TaxID=35523 RepID=UPI001EE9ED61|nr:protein tipE-like [Daphnia pulicaria]
MADFSRAEGVSGAGVPTTTTTTTSSSSCISSLSHHHLSSSNSIPSRSTSLLLPPVSQSQSQHTLSGSHRGSVMSGRPPRLQMSAGVKSSGSTVNKPATEVISAPVPTLDPVHRQKIMQLRLQAAKASMKRQSSLRRENIHRLAFWLLRTSLWLAGIFSLTVLIIAFPLAVDPALESIWRTFSTKPVICLTTDIQIHHSRNPDGSVKGNDACTWTSCRQGCTGELFRCVQLFANISRLPWDVLESANTSQWIRLDSTSQIELGGRLKRSTNWAVSWATQNKHLFNKSASTNQSINPLYEMQREHSRRQYAQLVEELKGQQQLDDERNETTSSLFEAVNVRLMVNVRGCGYTVDCADFHRTAGVIGSLIPCHLSSRADVTPLAVMEHNPEQDHNIILFLFTVPACVFSSAVFLLCCIHYQCCRPQLAKMMASRSSAEYSVARLIINSGIQFHPPTTTTTTTNNEQPSNNIKYWAAPTEETCVSPEAPLAAQQLNHQLT